jgi:hypothetical protein
MRGWKGIFFVFKVFMALIYVSAGVVILFTDLLPLPISDKGKTIFGIVLMLYGFFRIYTYSKVFKTKGNED